MEIEPIQTLEEFYYFETNKKIMDEWNEAELLASKLRMKGKPFQEFLEIQDTLMEQSEKLRWFWNKYFTCISDGKCLLKKQCYCQEKYEQFTSDCENWKAADN